MCIYNIDTFTFCNYGKKRHLIRYTDSRLYIYRHIQKYITYTVYIVFASYIYIYMIISNHVYATTFEKKAEGTICPR